MIIRRSYRNIFPYNPSESIKSVIYLMQRLDFHKLYDLKRLVLINKLSHLHHEITAEAIMVLEGTLARKNTSLLFGPNRKLIFFKDFI